MPMPLKPTPVKFCVYCGKQMHRRREPDGGLQSLFHFSRQKYCDRVCMAKAFDAKVSMSDAWAVTHYHARKLVPKGLCARCGKPNASDVHHRDGEHTNNDPANLERICRSCHTLEHRTVVPCTICGKPQKGLGYCNTHYIRWKRYGDPLAYKVPPQTMCSVCGKPTHSKGLCGMHFMRQKRGQPLE